MTSMDHKYILLTVDVEDWFQVENLRTRMPYSKWTSSELRAEQNIANLLNLLDSFRVNTLSGYGVPKATFFILGWLADRLPHMVREIQSRGHEIASHGYKHDRCDILSPDLLKADMEMSRKMLEDITGNAVLGYRAPNFSINDDIIQMIRSCKYVYDSSYNSFHFHGRYGDMTVNKKERRDIAIPVSDDFYELPISNLRIGGQVVPWGGGAYFRLIPFSVFQQGIRMILKQESAYLFYMHPWEIDPNQPVVSGIPKFLKFRHYVNLRKTSAKLSAFLKTFRRCCFATCRQYLEQFHRISEKT